MVSVRWWGVDWGVAPLWFGVLVMWCVCVHVGVFLRAAATIVGWWCWCVGGVLPGGRVHHCGLVVWGVAPLLIIRIHKYSKRFEHAQTAQNHWKPIGMLRTKSKHTGVLPGACPPFVVWCVGVLVVCFLLGPTPLAV